MEADGGCDVRSAPRKIERTLAAEAITRDHHLVRVHFFQRLRLRKHRLHAPPERGAIAPQARTLAEDRGLRCVVVDYDALRGIERDELTLF